MLGNWVMCIWYGYIGLCSSVKEYRCGKEIWLALTDVLKVIGVEVGLLWGVIEIFLEVVLTIMNLLFLTSQW